MPPDNGWPSPQASPELAQTYPNIPKHQPPNATSTVEQFFTFRAPPVESSSTASLFDSALCLSIFFNKSLSLSLSLPLYPYSCTSLPPSSSSSSFLFPFLSSLSLPFPPFFPSPFLSMIVSPRNYQQSRYQPGPPASPGLPQVSRYSPARVRFPPLINHQPQTTKPRVPPWSLLSIMLVISPPTHHRRFS